MVDNVALGQGFSPSTLVFPRHTHFTKASYSSDHLPAYMPEVTDRWIYISTSWRGGKLWLGRIRATCWYNVCWVTFVWAFQLFHSFFLYSFLCGNIRKSWPPPDFCPLAHDVDNIRFLLIPLLKRFINAFCFNVNSLVVASSELYAEVQWCTGCCGCCWVTVSWPSDLTIKKFIFSCIEIWFRLLGGFFIPLSGFYSRESVWDLYFSVIWY